MGRESHRAGSSKKPSALDFMELGYDMTGTTGEWLERLTAATYARFGAGLGMQSFTYEITADRHIKLGEVCVVGLPEMMIEQTKVSMEVLPPEFLRQTFVQCIATTQSASSPETLARIQPVRDMLESAFGWKDLLIIGGMDPTDHGVYLGVALPEVMTLPRRVAAEWTRVSVHLAAAHRLRRRLGGNLSPETADAILTPSGRAEHATGDAEAGDARAQLRRAVKDTEQARGKLRHTEPERAVDLWKGLVASRWTLVDHFETDGKRYVLARRNDVNLTGLDTLSERERQVAGYAAMGHSNKLIAYDMGLSDSTVRVLLHRAAKKLGVTTREEIIATYVAAVSPAVH